MNASIFKYIYILGIFFILFSCTEDETSILINDEGSIEVEDLTITGEILVLVNQHRQEIGLEALKRSTIADELAIEHTNYIHKIRGIPRTYILIEGRGIVEHIIHISYTRGIPRTYILIKRYGI